MATKADIKQAVYDELATIMGNFVASPYDHVDVANGQDDPLYPHIGFEEFSRPERRGLDGAIHVHSKTYLNGNIDSITYRKDKTYRFDFYVQDNEDDEGEKDQIYTALEDQFDKYNMWLSPSDFHADVKSIELDTSDDADRQDDAIRGDRVRLDIEAGRFQTYDGITAMQQIHLDMDSDGADAVNETISS